MEEYLREIRENLFDIMRKKGWNNTELAIQCGVSTRQMSWIMNGEGKDIKLSTLIKISKGVGKSPASLIMPGGLEKEKNEETLRKIHVDLITYLRRCGVSGFLATK